jgi:hypothetical protein
VAAPFDLVDERSFSTESVVSSTANSGPSAAAYNLLTGPRRGREPFVITAIEFIATLSAALFAGAALYINVVEHPARMGLDTALAVAQWAPSYRRATWLQAPLAVLSLVTGLSAWVLGGDILWAIGALLIGMVVPFTFLAIMPTNHRLLAPGRDLESAETRALLDTWAKLHAVRTALSLVATALYLWCTLAH